MKKIVLSILLFLNIFIFGQEFENIKIVNGVVVEQKENILKIVLKDDKDKSNDEIIELVIGPKWYVDYNDIRLKKGEIVEIEYSEDNNIKHIRKIIINFKDKIKRYNFINDNNEFLWIRHGFGGFGRNRNVKKMRRENRGSGNRFRRKKRK